MRLHKFIGKLLIINSFVGASFAGTLIMEESKRVEAEIARDSMNRLAVSNDRIVSVFGDEGAFVTQTDEQNGQVFIKPSIENKEIPLSLTIVTENGLTQDLLLSPKKSKASTIILKPFRNSKKQTRALLPGMPRQGEDYVGQVVQTLKKAMLGELPIINEGCFVKRKPIKGISLHHKKSYESEMGIVQKWLIKNKGRTSVEVREEELYVLEDIGISIPHSTLEPGEMTYGFILRDI